MSSEPRLIVLINKSLEMRAGKIAAQTTHAVISLLAHMEVSNPPYHACIVLYVADDTALFKAAGDAAVNDIPHGAVICDEGLTAVPPYSRTALALLGTRGQLDPITKGLELVK